MEKGSLSTRYNRGEGSGLMGEVIAQRLAYKIPSEYSATSRPGGSASGLHGNVPPLSGRDGWGVS